VATLPAAQLPDWLAADANRVRGEFVLVLHAPQRTELPADGPNAAALGALEVLLRELPLKQAVRLAAQLSGAPRNALYQAALQRKAGAADTRS
jgi:16S rRNA (cytidine1402-2'-O)-methyltransferase